MFVAEWARGAGLEVELDEAAPGRPNVIATAQGSGGGRTLLLNGHLDTVGYEGMSRRRSSRASRTGRLYGRGAYDMKGGLAACLVAAAEAGQRGLRGDVVVTAVVDEELTSIGTQSVLKRVRAGRGDRRRADSDGVAHRPQGVRRVRDRDARARRARLAARSGDRRDREDGPRPRRAGRARPVAARAPDAPPARLAGRCTRGSSRAARRSRPTRSAACSRPSAARCPASRSTTSRRSSRACSTGSSAATRTSRGRGGRSRPGGPSRSARTRRSCGSCGSHAGAGTPVGETYWADSALIAEALIPTVLFGPGGDGAHAQVEWVSVADVERCAAVFLSVATEFCA